MAIADRIFIVEENIGGEWCYCFFRESQEQAELAIKHEKELLAVHSSSEYRVRPFVSEEVINRKVNKEYPDYL